MADIRSKRGKDKFTEGGHSYRFDRMFIVVYNGFASQVCGRRRFHAEMSHDFGTRICPASGCGTEL